MRIQLITLSLFVRVIGLVSACGVQPSGAGTATTKRTGVSGWARPLTGPIALPTGN